MPDAFHHETACLSQDHSRTRSSFQEPKRFVAIVSSVVRLCAMVWNGVTVDVAVLRWDLIPRSG